MIAEKELKYPSDWTTLDKILYESFRQKIPESQRWLYDFIIQDEIDGDNDETFDASN